MSDDLVKRLLDEEGNCVLCGGTGELQAKTLRDERDTVGCPACMELEAATRLATPPGNAVEVVARALERARHVIDAYAWPHHKNDPINVPGLTIAAVLTEITEARAALAALSSIPERAHGEQMREAGGWQPIETAPRDGSKFLTWCKFYGVRVGKCHVRADHDDWLSNVGAFGDSSKGGMRATHWRPLPLPPAEDAP